MASGSSVGVRREHPQTPGEGADLSGGAQRRQVTVVFCDVVGSTRLSSRMEPEDFHELIMACQDQFARAVNDHGGFIARYMGDGILAYFGYPRAAEDASVRAICAARAAVQAIGTLLSPDQQNLQAKAGLATGVGIVGEPIGEGMSREVSLNGQVANMAARILALAGADEVLVSDSTWRLAGADFECTDLGQHELRGFDGQTRLWRIDAERRDHSRLEDLMNAGGRRFFGRASELELLDAAWLRSRHGQGQVVLVCADAGCGKSALISQFRARQEGGIAISLLIQGNERHAHSAWHPVTGMLRRLAAAGGGEAQDPASRLLERLGDTAPAEARAVLDSLLAPDAHPLPASLAGTPEQVATLTREVLLQLVETLTRQDAVLLVVEDLQWLDASTRALLAALARLAARLRLMAIGTSRPGGTAPWRRGAHVSEIELPPLPPTEILRVVELLDPGRRLSQLVVEQIVARTDGIPLFAEELTRDMLDLDGAAGTAPAHPASSTAVPASLQDILAARLDRLGDAKGLAQLGAAIGRRFPAALLEALSGLPAARHQRAIARLLDSGLLRRSSAGDELEFKHALVQDAAYGSLLRAQRRQLHQHIARHLAAGGAAAACEPETLAQHWLAAQQAREAIPLLLAAARRDLARGGNDEALRHAAQAIEQLPGIDDPRERERAEFALQLAFGQASYVVHGPAAAPTTRAYARAQALIRAADTAEQRFLVLYGIFSRYHFATEFELAREPAEAFRELAQREGSDGHHCQAHRMSGYLAFFEGRMADADRHFEALAQLYQPALQRDWAAPYGADCRVAAFGFKCLVEALTGRPRSGSALAAANLEYALSLGHPASVGWAYAASAYLHQFLEDPDATLRLASQGAEYCRSHRIGSWGAHCQVFSLWAQGFEDPAPATVEHMRAAVEAAATGNRLGLPQLKVMLASTLRRCGRLDAAVELAQAALDEVRSTGQRVFLATAGIELGRSLAARPGGGAAARAALQQAALDAAAMGMHLLELRARLLEVRSTTGAGIDTARLAALQAHVEDCPGLADHAEAARLLHGGSTPA